MILSLVAACASGSKRQDTTQGPGDSIADGSPDLTGDVTEIGSDMADVQVPTFSVKSLQQGTSSKVCPPEGLTTPPELQIQGLVELKGVLATTKVHRTPDGYLRVYVSDVEGGHWGGIAVVSQRSLKVEPGDLLNLVGQLQEAKCFTRIEVKDSDSLTVVSKGLQLPPALTVNCGDLKSASTAESVEGVLVKVFGVTIDQTDDANQLMISKAGCSIGNEFSVFSPLLAAGNAFNSVTGVVSFDGTRYVINPRSADDFNLQSQGPDDASDSTDALADLQLDTVADAISDTIADAIGDAQADSITDANDGGDIEPDLTAETIKPDPQPPCNFQATELINEVWYDPPGADDWKSSLSFIELLGPAGAPVGPTSGQYFLEYIWGRYGIVLLRIDMSKYSYGSNGLLVIVDDSFPNVEELSLNGTTVVKICTDSACETLPDPNCQCVADENGLFNTVSGLSYDTTAGLLNEAGCLRLQGPILTVDAVCWRDPGGWPNADGSYWSGEPFSWQSSFATDLNFPIQDSESNSLGRLDCTEADDNRLDFHPTYPTPGSLNKPPL